LNPNDLADAKTDCNGDGFTNIEKFIDGLDPHHPFEWIDPPVISFSSGRERYSALEPSDANAPPTVVISKAPFGTEIRYTTDGSEPSASSDVYKGPFELKKSSVVRAKDFKAGKESSVTNQALQILEPHEPASVMNPSSGLDYSYYENGEWRGFPELDSLKPAKTGTADNIGIGPSTLTFGYGLKFGGYVKVPHDGVYTFFLRSNELSRLIVDGETLAMSQSRKRQYSGAIALKAGFHTIEASIYFPTEGPERTFEISWEGPGFSKQILPANVLFRSGK